MHVKKQHMSGSILGEVPSYFRTPVKQKQLETPQQKLPPVMGHRIDTIDIVAVTHFKKNVVSIYKCNTDRSFILITDLDQSNYEVFFVEYSNDQLVVCSKNLTSVMVRFYRCSIHRVGGEDSFESAVVRSILHTFDTDNVFGCGGVILNTDRQIRFYDTDAAHVYDGSDIRLVFKLSSYRCGFVKANADVVTLFGVNDRMEAVEISTVNVGDGFVFETAFEVNRDIIVVSKKSENNYSLERMTTRSGNHVENNTPHENFGFCYTRPVGANRIGVCTPDSIVFYDGHLEHLGTIMFDVAGIVYSTYLSYFTGGYFDKDIIGGLENGQLRYFRQRGDVFMEGFEESPFEQMEEHDNRLVMDDPMEDWFEQHPEPFESEPLDVDENYITKIVKMKVEVRHEQR